MTCSIQRGARFVPRWHLGACGTWAPEQSALALLCLLIARKSKFLGLVRAEKCLSTGFGQNLVWAKPGRTELSVHGF